MGNAVQRAYEESDSSSEHELIDNAAPDQPGPAEQNEEEQPTSLFGAVSLYFGSGSVLSSNESFGFPDDPLAAQPSLAEFSSPLSKTPTIKSAVNLNKGSLKLVSNPDDPKKFGMVFVVDAATNCSVKVTADGGVEYSQIVNPGSGEAISTPLILLNSETFSAEAGIDGGVFSLDIQLTSDDQDYPIRSQSTHCLIVRVAEDTYEIKAVKQKVMYNDVPYIVYDIFGLESGTALAEDCVICLSDVKDTILIPCRHLCICSPCAQVLKFQSNKCPICRASVRSMLSVNVKAAPRPTDVLNVELDSDEDSTTEKVVPLEERLIQTTSLEIN